MKRYNIVNLDEVAKHIPDCYGDWVRWEDANAEIERITKEKDAIVATLHELALDWQRLRDALEGIAAPGDDRWFVSVAREALGGDK